MNWKIEFLEPPPFIPPQGGKQKNAFISKGVSQNILKEQINVQLHLRKFFSDAFFQKHPMQSNKEEQIQVKITASKMPFHQLKEIKLYRKRSSFLLLSA